MLDDAVEEKAGGEKVRVGMVVSAPERKSTDGRRVVVRVNCTNG